MKTKEDGPSVFFAMMNVGGNPRYARELISGLPLDHKFVSVSVVRENKAERLEGGEGSLIGSML